MSNKTQLQTNNTALDGYITRINAAKEVAAGLPEAGGGGGGSLETYSGKISYELIPSPLTVTYTDSTLNYTTVTIDSLTNINVVKNTIVFITDGRCNAISGCTRLGGGVGSYAYLITANNFEIQMPAVA